MKFRANKTSKNVGNFLIFLTILVKLSYVINERGITLMS